MSKAMSRAKQTAKPLNKLKEIKENPTQLFFNFIQQQQYNQKLNIKVNNDSFVLTFGKKKVLGYVVDETTINLSIYFEYKKGIRPDLSINMDVKNKKVQGLMFGIINNMMDNSMATELITNQLIKLAVNKTTKLKL